MIYIGSTAIRFWLSGQFRDARDVDVVATSDLKALGYDTIVLPEEILKEIPQEHGYATLEADIERLREYYNNLCSQSY